MTAADQPTAFTEWCSQPDDHCLNGTCHYGDHGPLTADAEDALRGGGYGSYIDEAEEVNAADQPTTEPSAVERAAEVLDRAWSDHHAACVAWSEDTDPATLGDHPRLLTNLDLAQALADAGLLAAAAQPAADKCDGSGRCTARLHVHGCFADLDGHCDDPDDHVGTQPAADTETEVQWGVRRLDGMVAPYGRKNDALRRIAAMGGTLVSIREEA